MSSEPVVLLLTLDSALRVAATGDVAARSSAVTGLSEALEEADSETEAKGGWLCRAV
ncbi:hypothetical protein OZX57_06700 [Bifidobacterium sp. ESL0682]|uniref:hypothetical protein n=1 Tax=Bifidobacterium sp. ESL0682 TaxID=2983212 RepID=UPI0023F65691|nr:hypothetical protein [Bifidobacterium sp. ESL0682]WEV41669.1 hypothetical protein OZX57_06700 [Bifidobacterium sp. ESL0682]